MTTDYLKPTPKWANPCSCCGMSPITNKKTNTGKGRKGIKVSQGAVNVPYENDKSVLAHIETKCGPLTVHILRRH